MQEAKGNSSRKPELDGFITKYSITRFPGDGGGSGVGQENKTP